jgi:hypothetical protein
LANRGIVIFRDRVIERVPTQAPLH